MSTSAPIASDAAASPVTLDPEIFTRPSFGDIPLDCIRVSKTNPRKIFSEDHLQDLAASIKKQGVAQPILVRPMETVGDVTYFELVAGERRFRASRIAGMPTVPAVVRTLTDREAFELQVLENLQRVDLHPLEEAEGFEALMRQFNVSADELAEKVGKSKAYIYASLKLCALESKPRAAFYAGTLTKSTALLVARIPVKNLQEKCVKEITEGWQGLMSFRRAAEYIEREYMLQLSKAAFKPSDDSLRPEAGSCTACPKRTGNQPEIFTDVNANVCTDPVCYKAKGEAHVIRIKKLAIENGQTVLAGAEAKKIMPSTYGVDLKGGYVHLDKPVYSDAKNRTYRQILGKQAPASTLLESPHTGEIVHIVKMADIAPLLEEKGHKPASAQADAGRDREKEQEAKAKLEREYRKRLFMATHHASLLMNVVDMDLRLVALQMFDNLPNNTIPKKLVMELYGWTDETFSYPERFAKTKAAIDALTPAQLNQFIRDCALCRELDVNQYTATSKDKPENLLAFAARAKVNAKQIRSDVDGEAKAKADAKKKSVEKKASKNPGASPQTASKEPAPAAAVSGKNEGIEPAAVSAEPFPAPITVRNMQLADLVNLAKTATPEQFNDLKGRIVGERPDLLGALDQASLPRFVYDVSGFRLMEPGDVIGFLQKSPDRVNELATAIIDRGTDELAAAFSDATSELGYTRPEGLYLPPGMALKWTEAPHDDLQPNPSLAGTDPDSARAIAPPAADAIATPAAIPDQVAPIEETPAAPAITDGDAGDDVATWAAEEAQAVKTKTPAKAKSAPKAAPVKSAAKPAAAAPAKKPAKAPKAVPATGAKAKSSDPWPFPTTSTGKRESQPAATAQPTQETP